MDLLIKNGRVIDPANNIDANLDILVENSKIKSIAPKIDEENVTIIDASNKVVVPGLIDVHTHFREIKNTEGHRDKGTRRDTETIYTVSRAAAKGGFTTIICQPNIEPRIDNKNLLSSVINYAKKESIVNLYPSGCITKGVNHRELINIKEMRDAGAIKLTDDGDPVIYEELMYKALKEAKKNNIPVSSHCGLSKWAESILKKLGDKTINSKADTWRFYNSEVFFVRRDIRLAEKAGWSIHLEHISLRESVDEIRCAKDKGLKVTAEITPHHFILTKKDEKKYGTIAKVNPPLRKTDDLNALLEGLADGTIDIIASDHAPHSEKDKATDWEQAPFGIIGLETTLGLVLTELVAKNVLPLSEAIRKLTINPAKVFNLTAGSLEIGMPADITIIDLKKEWVVDINEFESMGRNCPFNGWKLKGKAITTIVNGKIVMQNRKQRTEDRNSDF
ncbi:dihydroorotase [candidate division WOR-3 bacterium]|nr:dihydroorotase [candidate division WOR-3 bacterium]